MKTKPDNELNDVANDVYDYLFNNDCNTDFVRSFEKSYIDNSTNTIYLDGFCDVGEYKITIERVTK